MGTFKAIGIGSGLSSFASLPEKTVTPALTTARYNGWRGDGSLQ